MICGSTADASAQAAVCGAMIWASFAAPAAIPQVFEIVSRAQLNEQYIDTARVADSVQFGHDYSAMFLSTVCTMSHVRQPQGFVLLMQNLAEAWRHGCDSPAVMGIEWEDDWHLDIASIRRNLARRFAGTTCWHSSNLTKLIPCACGSLSDAVARFRRCRCGG